MVNKKDKKKYDQGVYNSRVHIVYASKDPKTKTKNYQREKKQIERR